ncbi:MAG: hypothetical protein QM750_20515 [Rubrivivax sp.]
MDVELLPLIAPPPPRASQWLRRALPPLAIAVLLGVGAGGFWMAAMNRQEAQRWVDRLYESETLASRAGPARTADEAGIAADVLASARTAGFPVQGLLQSLESVRLAGTRLRSVAMDAQARTAVATFVLGAAGQALQVLDQLNAGQPSPPWKLRELRAGQGAFDGVFEYKSPGTQAIAAGSSRP